MASLVMRAMSTFTSRYSSSEPSSSGLEVMPAFSKSRGWNFSWFTISIPPFLRSAMLAFSAAGFIANNTSGASPGVKTSWLEKRIWKPETPASVPAGARISAGKSGNVERSLPASAVVFVN